MSEISRDQRASATGRRRETLRAAVLDAAEARVAASGLADLGVRQVAQDAGCSSGMVYKLFASHDELVLSVNARTLELLAAAVGAGLRGIGLRGMGLRGVDDPAGALCAMADAYLDFASANMPRWDALFAHRMTGGAALPGWYADQRDRMFDGLAATLGAAAIPVSGDFARVLFSAIHGVVALGLQEKVGAVAPDALRAELRALVSVIARGMFGAPPPDLRR